MLGTARAQMLASWNGFVSVRRTSDGGYAAAAPEAPRDMVF